MEPLVYYTNKAHTHFNFRIYLQERALGENVVRSEQARLAVGELVTGATDSSSTRVDLLTSLSHPQCALST